MVKIKVPDVKKNKYLFLRDYLSIFVQRRCIFSQINKFLVQHFPSFLCTSQHDKITIHNSKQLQN